MRAAGSRRRQRPRVYGGTYEMNDWQCVSLKEQISSGVGRVQAGEAAIVSETMRGARGKRWRRASLRGLSAENNRMRRLLARSSECGLAPSERWPRLRGASMHNVAGCASERPKRAVKERRLLALRLDGGGGGRQRVVEEHSKLIVRTPGQIGRVLPHDVAGSKWRRRRRLLRRRLWRLWRRRLRTWRGRKSVVEQLAERVGRVRRWYAAQANGRFRCSRAIGEFGFEPRYVGVRPLLLVTCELRRQRLRKWRHCRRDRRLHAVGQTFERSSDGEQLGHRCGRLRLHLRPRRFRRTRNRRLKAKSARLRRPSNGRV